MTKQTATAAAKQATTADRKPTHRLYSVNNAGEKSIWTPIGAAWANKDGKGFTLSCDAMPLQGRIVMRAIKPQDTRQQAMV